MLPNIEMTTEYFPNPVYAYTIVVLLYDVNMRQGHNDLLPRWTVDTAWNNLTKCGKV